MDIFNLLEEMATLNEGATIKTMWDFNDCEILESSGGGKAKGGDEPSQPGSEEGPKKIDIDPPEGEGSDNSGGDSDIEIDFSIGDIIQDSKTKQYGRVVGIYGDELETEPVSKEEIGRMQSEASRGKKLGMKMKFVNDIKVHNYDERPKPIKKKIKKNQNDSGTIRYKPKKVNWGSLE